MRGGALIPLNVTHPQWLRRPTVAPRAISLLAVQRQEWINPNGGSNARFMAPPVKNNGSAREMHCSHVSSGMKSAKSLSQSESPIHHSLTEFVYISQSAKVVLLTLMRVISVWKFKVPNIRIPVGFRCVERGLLHREGERSENLDRTSCVTGQQASELRSHEQGRSRIVRLPDGREKISKFLRTNIRYFHEARWKAEQPHSTL